MIEPRPIEPVPTAWATLEDGSSSFAAAARLLDPATRESAAELYAWCRYCDDVVDGQILGHAVPGRSAVPEDALEAPKAALSRVAALAAATRDALAGAPAPNPRFAGLAAVVRRHAIPLSEPLDLIAGFAMDAEGRVYDSLEDTLDYAYHVAGVVGVMMARIMGVGDPATLRHAADLGLAFQLTNIARDVVEDARAGRVYLPAHWLRAEGVPRDALAEPRYREAVARATARLLDAAEPYYDSALVGIAALPWRTAAAVGAARSIYRAIGRIVRRRGAAAWDRRVATGTSHKLVLAFRGGCGGAASALIPRPVSALAPRDGLWTPPALRETA